MDNVQLNNRYLDIVKSRLNQLDDKYLISDIDLLCEYIVKRFLDTSPVVVTSISEDDICFFLEKFIKDIWPFIMVFVIVVNSLPISSEITA